MDIYRSRERCMGEKRVAFVKGKEDTEVEEEEISHKRNCGLNKWLRGPCNHK